MVRIRGVDLPIGKRVEYALPYIYGLGLKTSQDVLTKLKINFSTRVRDLTEAEVAALSKEITDNYVTEGDLRKEVKQHIRRLQDIGCYRGSRHKKSLPVRGQRTRTNARTRKGPRRMAVSLKRKITKK
jgi:small subunit ribosomal protein S13